MVAQPQTGAAQIATRTRQERNDSTGHVQADRWEGGWRERAPPQATVQAMQHTIDEVQ
jgi:hypothetical protein